MKKIIFFCIIIIYALTTFSFIKKNQKNYTTSGPDSLSYIQFDMCPNEFKYSPLNTALLKESDFLSKFGKPVKRSRKYSKIDKTYSCHIVYTGAETWYENDTLKALIFTGSNYKFVLTNGTAIKVGDSISSVSELFPNSWANRQSHLMNQVFVGLSNSSGPLDAGLLFEFKPNSGIITTIAIIQ